MKQVIEPSAAVGLAVALENQAFHQEVLQHLQNPKESGGKEEVRIVIVWTGGNVELEKIVAALSAQSQ